MSITLRQLRAFVTVAEKGNFTRAAQALHMAQPMVSALVRELEAELGFRLFDRTTRRVELTPAAAEFLTDARRMIGELDRAVCRARDIGARRRGHLSIGAPPLLAATLLPGVIRAFAESAPGVSVTLYDQHIAAIGALLRDGEVQLAVGTFRQEEQGLVRVPLIADRLSLLCRADHPLAGRAEPGWAELEGVPLITLRTGNGIRHQVERGYEAAGMRAEPAAELDQIGTVIAMVEAGFGVTVLPPYALGPFAAQSLVLRPLTHPSVTREIELVYREERSLSPAAAEFVRLLRIGAARLQALPGDAVA
ncbi:LysR family transcriptional regulator [Roseomonas sp. KE2513]|uniref:LysR family transcriptional regulator n=1 Tax=Roseomonas sp. KE2513 TaxID=2479202 RepID=UPI0018DF4638|nr:LysR family transcriptional regulator [Roseomonas sp. KE2513]MBI0536089.1 LysR family transcriptional regulator [Roseomonas sp. KE2513]